MKMKGINGAEYVVLTCMNCGKKYTLPVYRIRSYEKRTGHTPLYCSYICYAEFRKKHNGLNYI